MTQKLFNQIVSNSEHCLHHMLPTEGEQSAIDRLRSPQFSAHGLNPGDFVLDGDPAILIQKMWTQLPLTKKGRSPSPIFSTCLLLPNASMNQDGTWRGGEPWSRPHCVVGEGSAQVIVC